MLVCLAAAFVACGEEQGTVVAPEPGSHDRLPAPPPSSDSTPPVFAGLESVELVGYERYRLTWSAATDDRTDSDAIRYQIHHIVEPYRELGGEDGEPALTTEPGVLEVTIALEAPSGRFYVLAVDETENLSLPAAGLAQRARRPWVRAADGTMVARVIDCVQLEPGRGLCAGEEGYAALWERDHWQVLETGTTANLRVVRGAEGAFLFSDVGHLFHLTEQRLELVDVVFDGAGPTLPFRQFATDHLGLRYWLDGLGQLFIGAERQYRRAQRPLALPDQDACPRLRGIAFSDVASFALCIDGTAYSVSHRQPGVQWLSLTPNADFELPEGLHGVLAESDTEALYVDPTGIRDVGVGGWSPVLLVDWHVGGVHPMDIPDDPPGIARIGDVRRIDGGDLVAVTDIGLLERRRARWELVAGSAGPLVGLLDPTPIEPSEQRTLIYDDGAVARVRRGRVDWQTPRQLSGFAFAVEATDGTPISVIARRDAGVLAWRDGRWERVAPTPPGVGGSADGDGAAALHGLAVTASSGLALLAWGADGDGEGAIWGLAGDRWVRAGAVYPPPPEPEAEEDLVAVPEGAGTGLVFELAPPPALTGVPAGDLATPPPAMEPIIDLSADPDGRAVAVSQHQVWWRLPGSGWLYLGRRPGVVSAVALDAAETYVLVEDGQVVRCWRDTCGEPALPAESSPTGIIQTWREAGLLVALDSSGATQVFAPAQARLGEPMNDPAVETPAGAWRTQGSVLPAYLVDTVRMRRTRTDFDVVWTFDGEIMEHRGERWRLEAIAQDAIALFAEPARWTILDPGGLFALGEVPPVVRESP